MTNHRKHPESQWIQQFTYSTYKRLDLLSFSLCRLEGHRLMSRLPSQFLLPAASPIPPFSKKGCLRESPSTSLLVGSYSNMLSMRSNNWWCSSASDSKYRWQGKGGWRMGNKEIKSNTEKKRTAIQNRCTYLLLEQCMLFSFWPYKLSTSHPLFTRRGLQFSLTYFPAEELSSQSRRPR